MANLKEKIIERPPVVVVMGHIDHGKSKLLDYIRKTNVVDLEAGGITQHISSYEVVHKSDEKGTLNRGKASQEEALPPKKVAEKRITFLDTPGHSAFSAMRIRGANVADVAILVVSAEDGVKPQTLEVYEAIRDAKIPFVVAINKIDKPSANVEKTISDLIEHQIYLEGYGGDIPYNKISAETGEGIDELLNTILLVSEIEEFKGDENKNAEGYIIETNVDPKKGISATLIIKNGHIKNGMFVVAGKNIAPTRILEDFVGKKIKEAIFSSPIKIVGFNNAPEVGTKFTTHASKKEAEKQIEKNTDNTTICKNSNEENNKNVDKFVVPIAIKADVLGSVEAIESEIEKLITDGVCINVVKKGIGAISENDIKSIGVENGIAIGFNIPIEEAAKRAGERINIEIKTFNIIYELTDWLKEKIEEIRPQKEVEKLIGKAKILAIFSKTKDKQVVGGKVLEGVIRANGQIKIFRRGEKIGTGKILELQQSKAKSNEASEGNEFGTNIESKMTISKGDTIELFTIIKE